MAKEFVVNGTAYTKAAGTVEGAVTLSSSKHATVFVTTIDELRTQYGRKQAFFVLTRLKGAHKS